MPQPNNSRDRNAAIRWAVGVVSDPHIVYLDTETTGLRDDAEIVDIAIIDARGRVLFNSLVHPRRAIPRDASAIHGITDRMVAGAPGWSDIQPNVGKILKQASQVVIYNSEFDVRIMNQVNRESCCPRFSANWQCALKPYAAFAGIWHPRYRNWRYQKLTHAAGAFGAPPGDAHRALADVRMCQTVVHGMAGRYSSAEPRAPRFTNDELKAMEPVHSDIAPW